MSTLILIGGTFVGILIILFVKWPRWIAKNDPSAIGPVDNAVKQTSRGLMEGSLAMGIICLFIWMLDQVIPDPTGAQYLIFGVIVTGILVLIFCLRD